MEKGIKALIVVLMYSIGIKAQNQVLHKDKDFYVTPQNDSFFITTYTFCNNFNGNTILWFGLSNKDSSANQYFYKLKGEVSLIDILNDDNVNNKRFDIIDQTFIKNIKPNEKFSVTVVFRVKENWVRDRFEKNIFLVREAKLNSGLKNALKRNIDFCYKSNFISLYFEQLKSD